MHETSLGIRTPVSGGATYYPAHYRGTFASVRAALAAIGCNGAAAEPAQANARAEGSPAVAVPVKVSGVPPEHGDCVGLVLCKPGGRADLYLGLVSESRDDAAEAQAAAAMLAEACPGRWMVCEWVRQARAVQ